MLVVGLFLAHRQPPGGSEDARGWVAAATWLLPMPLSSSLLRECGFCGMTIGGCLRAFSIIGRTSPGHVWVSIWSESDLRGSMLPHTLGAGISGGSSGQLPARTDFSFILCPLLLFCPALPPLPHQAVPLPATTNSKLEIHSFEFTVYLLLKCKPSCCLS